MPANDQGFARGEYHKHKYYFGSVWAYHCEDQPGTASRYCPPGVKAVLATGINYIKSNTTLIFSFSIVT